MLPASHHVCHICSIAGGEKQDVCFWIFFMNIFAHVVVWLLGAWFRCCRASVCCDHCAAMQNRNLFTLSLYYFAQAAETKGSCCGSRWTQLKFRVPQKHNPGAPISQKKKQHFMIVLSAAAQWQQFPSSREYFVHFYKTHQSWMEPTVRHTTLEMVWLQLWEAVVVHRRHKPIQLLQETHGSDQLLSCRDCVTTDV